MGYTTEFDGSISISPPLNVHEIAYLRKFAASRRMDRERGPYFVDGSGLFGQGRDGDIRDFNQPPVGQPGLWCKWEPTEDGTAIKWNGEEKFYDSDEWMTYLIDTFLKPGAVLACELASPVPGRHYPEEFRHFTFDHELNGVIDAQGELDDDRWQLVVTGNTVTSVLADSADLPVTTFTATHVRRIDRRAHDPGGIPAQDVASDPRACQHHQPVCERAVRARVSAHHER